MNRCALGDIERALMEWRSLLRHIVAAPDLEWDRWREIEIRRRRIIVENTKSPTVAGISAAARLATTAG